MLTVFIVLVWCVEIVVLLLSEWIVWLSWSNDYEFTRFFRTFVTNRTILIANRSNLKSWRHRFRLCIDDVILSKTWQIATHWNSDKIPVIRLISSTFDWLDKAVWWHEFALLSERKQLNGISCYRLGLVLPYDFSTVSPRSIYCAKLDNHMEAFKSWQLSKLAISADYPDCPDL